MSRRHSGYTDPEIPIIELPKAIAALPGHTPQVWQGLAEYGAHQHPVTITKAALARRVGVSRPTIYRALDRLVEAGYARQTMAAGNAWWKIFFIPQKRAQK